MIVSFVFFGTNIVLGSTPSPDTTENVITMKPPDPPIDSGCVGACCLMPNYCHQHAACHSTDDAHGIIGIISAIPKCSCLPGFIGDGKTKGSGCVNLDECAEGLHDCEQICVDASPGFSCACHSGFRLRSNQRACEDEDECAAGTHNCEHACENTVGSFVCSCAPGYNLTSGHSCEDIDECQGDNQCPYPELCHNTEGAYDCGCPQGYTSEGHLCVNVNECLAEHICGDNKGCRDTAGSYDCFCLPGFTPHESPDGLDCQDVNECLDPEICRASDGSNPRCVNTVGGFTCVCPSGFEFEPTSRQCQDIDECSFDPCGLKMCVNTEGGYVCVCGAGYREVGDVCEDIDECAEGMHICEAGCSNTDGSYECVCDVGFYSAADGYGVQKCFDIDECKLGLCFGKCLNIFGGFVCSCPTGHFETEMLLDSFDGQFDVQTRATLESLKVTESEIQARTSCKPLPLCSFSMAALDLEPAKAVLAARDGSLGDLLCPDSSCIDDMAGYRCDCPAGFHSPDMLVTFLPSHSFDQEVATPLLDRHLWAMATIDLPVQTFEDLCFDTNECLVNASCPAATPCCTNTYGSFKCAARVNTFSGFSCPLGMIDTYKI
ncbi:MAG: uncharacterized protein KVP18_004747 [Porospora cf. gigantea A]|uniref:uncharacterized protein n=1 Tax=Porospora cf. gigantea A TaxID=2853593 RepID=UPI00355AB235|nr:MAG: hypothetical protein KVP18_004747 [Porospora cf. gigantea A]